MFLHYRLFSVLLCGQWLFLLTGTVASLSLAQDELALCIHSEDANANLWLHGRLDWFSASWDTFRWGWRVGGARRNMQRAMRISNSSFQQFHGNRGLISPEISISQDGRNRPNLHRSATIMVVPRHRIKRIHARHHNRIQRPILQSTPTFHQFQFSSAE